MDPCPTSALAVSGMEMSVEQVMDEVRHDLGMYRRTGGGVTLSGGEPSAQYDFAMALLATLRGEGIHAALDSCAFCDPGRFLALARSADLVLFDIKHAAAREHRRATGADNGLILSNLRALGECETPVEVRVPVIPGINAGDEDIDAIARLIADNRYVRSVVLLGYHPLGRSKIYAFDRHGEDHGFVPPGGARLKELAERIAAITGLPVVYR